MAAKRKKKEVEAKTTKTEETSAPEIKRTVPFQRDLVCDLNNEELQEKGAHLARQVKRQAEIKSKFDEVKKRWGARIGEVAQDITMTSTIIGERRETRLVDCEKVYDYATGQVTEYRKDTGERLESRPMTEAEKEGGLDAGENDPDKELGGEDLPPEDDDEDESDSDEDLDEEDDS